MDHTKDDLSLKQAWYSALKRNSPCIICSECDPCAIELHHKHPLEKTNTVVNLVKKNRPFQDVLKETNKCLPLCSNCHKKVHWGSINIRYLYESPAKDGLVVIFNAASRENMELVVTRDIASLHRSPSIWAAMAKNRGQLGLL